VSLGQLLDPEATEQMAATLALLRDALTAGIRDVVLAAGLAAVGAWALSMLAPRGRLGEHVAPQAEPQPDGSRLSAGD
jgi:hypothetical protein